MDLNGHEQISKTLQNKLDSIGIGETAQVYPRDFQFNDYSDEDSDLSMARYDRVSHVDVMTTAMPSAILDGLVETGFLQQADGRPLNTGIGRPVLKLLDINYKGHTAVLSFEDLAETEKRAKQLPPLELETRVYFAQLDLLLEAHQNEWVLIYERTIVGYFSTEKEAIDEGYRQFGNVPFFTRQILEQQPVEFTPGSR